MKQIEKLKEVFDLEFVQGLIARGAEVFIVGGSVRDMILGKDAKDIDLIVRNMKIDHLMNHLQLWGKVDMVGESFGVIKFTYKGEIYDIALPRVDSPGKPLILVKQNNKNESSDVFKIKYGGTSNEKISKS